MVAIGGMNITGSSLAPTSSVNDPEGTGDQYVFDIDLNAMPNFTISWNFEANAGTEFNYYFDPAFTFPAGTPTLDDANGAFSYNVSLADAVTAGMTSATFSITGWQNLGPGTDSSDTDTITFNFTLCFAKGTGIATPHEDVAVEALKIGDLVTTADGRTVPVKWVGHVSINPMFNPADRLDPVRIRKGALGPNVPHTDLIVTADHGMILDGMVINASALINGDSIDWYPWKAIGKSLTYYHVETEAHDVIIANGATSETYLDIPDRQSFENYADYVALYGAERAIPEATLPRITNARLLPNDLRARLGIDAADSFGDLAQVV